MFHMCECPCPRLQTSPLAHLLGQGQREAVSDAVNTAVLSVMTAAAAAAAADASTGEAAPGAQDAGAAGASGSAAVATTSGAAAGSGGGGGKDAGGTGAGPVLRPALSVPEAAAAARSVSLVERLLQQLVAVQATLHEANGGQGGVFNLREHMLAPGAV